jgi:hypothetical protein
MRALMAALELEVGGKFTAAQRELAKRAAVVGVRIEHLETRWALGEQIDPLQLATLANSQRRLLAMLGLRREPPPPLPTPEDHMVARYKAVRNGAAA